MAALYSSKLLLCVGLLSACLFASPVRAGESGHAPEERCPEGEEYDEQHEPECCAPDLMMESSYGKVCQPSDMSVAVAITLILSFTFLISLQCFVHHHDVDMREYAYTVISSTVSIFSAVLTFQSFDGIVEDLICEPLKEATGLGTSMDLAIRLVHMLLWYAATQLTIAVVSRALMSQAWRSQEILLAKHPHKHVSAEASVNGHGHTNVMLQVEINSVCYGMVLAHLTGFASIEFWTYLQQIAPFDGSPLMTLVPLPLAVLAQLIFEKLTGMCRESYIALGGEKDWFETTWDSKCQHAEDEIMGLTLSVLIVNSLRYAINESFGHKCLPNSEQKEEGATCEFQRSGVETGWLFGGGLLFVILLFLTKLLFVKMSEEEDIEAQESRRLRHLILGENSQRTISSKSPVSLQDEETEKTWIAQFVERMEDVILTTLGMAYAWCLFHGTRQLLMVMNPGFLGKEQNATTLAVVLAAGMTYIAFIIVRILDRLADLPDEWTPQEVDDSIKTVIRGTSIFIGFAWEQTFDESLDQLAERTRVNFGPHAPAIAKLVFGSGCISVVFLSWKWYILPFVFKKGWRYGYVFSRNDLHDRCHELATHDKHFTLDHLHHVAEKLAEKSEEHAVRFDVAKSLSQDNGYKSIPANEVEALREEIKALKIHTKYLEEQLEEERKAREECKIHCTFLERQLAEERRTRSDMKTCCKKCGQEFVSGPLVNEAKKREYLLEFLERHLQEERTAHARCSPPLQRGVSNEGAEGRVITSDSSLSLTGSPEVVEPSLAPGPLKMHHVTKQTYTPVMSSTPVRFAFDPSYSAQDGAADQFLSSKASLLGPPVFTTPSPAEVEEGKTKTYFKRPVEITGQEFGAEQITIPSTNVIDEGARAWCTESESFLLRKSSEFAKLGLAERRTAHEDFDVHGQIGQRFGSQRFATAFPRVVDLGAAAHRSRSESSSSSIRRFSEFARPSVTVGYFTAGEGFGAEQSAILSNRTVGEGASDQLMTPELRASPSTGSLEPGLAERKTAHELSEEPIQMRRVLSTEKFATPSPRIAEEGAKDQSAIPELKVSRSMTFSQTPSFAANRAAQEHFKDRYAQEFGVERFATPSPYVDVVQITTSESKSSQSTRSPDAANSGFAENRADGEIGHEFGAERSVMFSTRVEEGAIAKLTTFESKFPPSLRKLRTSTISQMFAESDRAETLTTHQGAIDDVTVSELNLSPSPRKSSPSRYRERAGLAKKRPTQESDINEIIVSESKSSPSPRESSPSQISPLLVESDLAEKRLLQEGDISEITGSASKLSPSPRELSPSQISPLLAKSDLAEKRPSQEGDISEITGSASKSSPSLRESSPSQISPLLVESDLTEKRPSREGDISDITGSVPKSSPSPRSLSPSQRLLWFAESGLEEQRPAQKSAIDDVAASERKLSQSSKISPPSPRSSLLAKSGLAEESPPHEHDKKHSEIAQEFGAARSVTSSIHVLEEGKLADCNKIHRDLRKISDALEKLGASK